MEIIFNKTLERGAWDNKTGRNAVVGFIAVPHRFIITLIEYTRDNVKSILRYSSTETEALATAEAFLRKGEFEDYE